MDKYTFLKQKAVYREDGILTASGGYDWFEAPVVMADALLEDMINVVNPSSPFSRQWFRNIAFFLFLFYFIWIVTHSILHQQWPSTLLRTRRWLHPSENWTNMIDTTDNSPRKVPIPLAWTCGEYIAKYQDTLSSLSFFLFTFKLFQHDTTTYRYQIATHV